MSGRKRTPRERIVGQNKTTVRGTVTKILPLFEFSDIASKMKVVCPLDYDDAVSYSWACTPRHRVKSIRFRLNAVMDINDQHETQGIERSLYEDAYVNIVSIL